MDKNVVKFSSKIRYALDSFFWFCLEYDVENLFVMYFCCHSVGNRLIGNRDCYALLLFSTLGTVMWFHYQGISSED